MSWYKKAQVSLSPLTGKSNQFARNYIYRLVGNLTKGFFRDNSWENVSAIWQRLDENGIENNIEETRYFQDEHGQPMGKIWKFEVPFTNNKGKEQILHGTLTAHFAGSVKDPSDRYDISFII